MLTWSKRTVPSALNLSYESLIATNNNNLFLISSNADFIFKYSTINDEWNEFMTCSSNLNAPSHSAIFNPQRGVIYICTHSKLMECDINKKQMNILFTKSNTFGNYPCLFMVDTKLHIINRASYHHYTFDIKTTEFHRKENSKYFLYIASAVMRTRKSVITRSPCYGLIEYSLVDDTWKDMNIRAPDLVSNIIKTKNERYLIFIGGFRQSDIFVYDFREKKLMKSTIKKPSTGYLMSALDRDDRRDDLLVFGYINKLWKSDKRYKNVPRLPFCLIRLIGKWVCLEYIHLIGRRGTNSSYQHWCICVDDILHFDNH